MQVFQNLNGFAARSSTHVKHFFTRFGIEKCNWNHWNFFLSEKPACLRLCYDEPVEFFKFWGVS